MADFGNDGVDLTGDGAGGGGGGGGNVMEQMMAGLMGGGIWEMSMIQQVIFQTRSAVPEFLGKTHGPKRDGHVVVIVIELRQLF